MADSFDRLLEQNYYEGMRRFAPPIAPPFGAPAETGTIAKKLGTAAPPGPAVPEFEKVLREKPQGPFLTAAFDKPEKEEVEVEEGPSLNDRTMDRLSRLQFKEPEPELPLWRRLLDPTFRLFSWVEKIDATSVGLVYGTVMGTLHGKTLWQELGIKPGDSLWEGAEAYTRRLSTSAQIISEIIFSPFNLLPVVGFGGTIASKLGLKTGSVASGLARATSKLAREQVLAEGIMHKYSPVRVMQGSLRARASMVMQDEFNRLLSAPSILGRPAATADDVVMRIKALANGDWEYLDSILLHPQKVYQEHYIAKEVQAYFKAANRMEGFNKIVDDPVTQLGIPRTIKDASGREIANPILRKIMDDPYGFMKDPAKYVDDPARATQLKEFVDNASIDWDDYRAVIGGQQRHPAQVADNIFGLILQRAVPVNARAARGQWNAVHPMATLGNVMFRFHRGLLRHGLTHFYLLGRPAYTAYNQVMNFNMMLLQNPLRTLQHYLNPASKVRKHVKELWGTGADVPAYVEQGFGYGYMMGQEVLDDAARMAGKTLPLLGEGKFGAAVKDIAKEYHAVPATERPWIERMGGALINRPAGWVRGINVGGEQYFRSATYAIEHYKTFNRMQRSMAKELGIKEESLLSLSQFPDQLKAFVEGTPIPAEYVMPRHLLSTYEMSVVDRLVTELPENYTIMDMIGAIKVAKKEVPKHYDDLDIWYSLRSGPKPASEALNKLGVQDIEASMRLAGFADNEITKTVDDIWGSLTKSEKEFQEHIRARPWNKSQQDYINKHSTPELNEVWGRDLKMDEHFVEKIRVIAASAHMEALKLRNLAKGKGTEAFQKDIDAVYGRMAEKKMKTYDVWAEQKGKLWKTYDDRAVAGDMGLPINEIDSPVLMDTEQIQGILKQHGMEDMLNLEENTAMQMLGKARKEGLNSLDKFEAQTLKNWEELMKLRKESWTATSPTGEIGVTLAHSIPGAEHMSMADLVRVRNSSMAYAKREGNRVSQYALFNYASRTNVDWLMSTMMPYPYWQTRFILHWATRCIDNPSQFNALVVLMKHWSDATKDLPTFLMASPIKLDLPDGTQVRFSPSMYFFPLSYSGLEVLRYGDQVNDLVDATAMVQDFVGGYLYPTLEVGMGLMSYMFDAPGYRTRGVGIAKNPAEVIKDIVPQLKLLRGFMGFNTGAVKFALEHNMLTVQDINMGIRAIGDATTAGDLSISDAQAAIEDLQNGRANPIVVKYLGKSLKRGLASSGPRYSGLPVSTWYTDQQRSFHVSRLLYPDDETPPSPDLQRQILAAYPGLEVVRGTTVPAGLTRDQEIKWRASKEYYDTVGTARNRYLEEAMGALVKDFNNPEKGAVISPDQFMERRRELYTSYGAIVDSANTKAAKMDAPITTDEREMFWQDVGRPVWPKHPLDQLLEDYYAIEAENFPGTTALETDWQAFFSVREEFFMTIAPWERAWIEDYINDPSRPDADFRKAQNAVRRYWAVREAVIAKDPELQNLLTQLEYWERVDPDTAIIYKRHPKIIQFERVVASMRRRMRMDDAELEAALQKYWGYSSIY